MFDGAERMFDGGGAGQVFDGGGAEQVFDWMEGEGGWVWADSPDFFSILSFHRAVPNQKMKP